MTNLKKTKLCAIFLATIFAIDISLLNEKHEKYSEIPYGERPIVVKC